MVKARGAFSLPDRGLAKRLHFFAEVSVAYYPISGTNPVLTSLVMLEYARQMRQPVHDQLVWVISKEKWKGIVYFSLFCSPEY